MLDLFRATVRRRGEAEAIRYFDRRLSWRTLDRLSDAIAHRLRAGGVRRGDRVSIFLHNDPSTVTTSIAAWKVGAIPHLGNPAYRPAELVRTFADCRPATVVCSTAQVEVIRAALDAVGDLQPSVRTIDQPDPTGAGDPPDAEPFAAVAPSSDAPCLLLYTSGTTGQPKGALIRHGRWHLTPRTARSGWASTKIRASPRWPRCFT